MTMNSPYTVSKTRIQAGIWEGVVETSDPTSDSLPNIAVFHLDRPVRSVSVTPDGAGRWHLRIAIPPDILSDGAQVLMIRDTQTDETLDSFAIVAGEPLDDALHAEVILLRAELDMLKRAFRRHCLEG